MAGGLQAQVGTNFDEPTAGTVIFVDPAPVGLRFVDHLVDNNPAANMPTVTFLNPTNELGFQLAFFASRPPGHDQAALFDESSGIPRGDHVGVYTNGTIRGLSGMAAWSTALGNGYNFEDTDGRVTLTFDPVDLSGTTNPQFSMDYFIRATSYETNTSTSGADHVYIYLDIDNGASTVDMLDTRGLDIDALGIEGAIQSINQSLVGLIGSTVRLVVEVDVNAATERMVIDNISFSEGVRATGGSLPVELANFETERQASEMVDLNWTTFSETNNQGFYVERMLGVEAFFEVIGFVEGKGNTVAQTFYNFQDENPFTGVTYYRLKQIDFDGTVTYSEIRAVEGRERLSEKEVLIYPNPVQNALKVQLNNIKEATQKAVVTIVDTKGQLVYNRTQQVIPYELLIITEVKDLMPSSYILVIELSDGTQLKQAFVKR